MTARDFESLLPVEEDCARDDSDNVQSLEQGAGGNNSVRAVGATPHSRRRNRIVVGVLTITALVGLVSLAPWSQSPARTHKAGQGVLVAEEAKEPEATHCSAAGENCSATKCCSGAGMQCYKKDASWAECKASCIPGPDPLGLDAWPWSCDKLGARTSGEAPKCSKVGEDCSKSHCCETSGMQCYEKVPGYATCKLECKPGMDLTDVDSTEWTCKELGRRTPTVGDWVSKMCAPTGVGCMKTQCCSTPGMTCYEKNPYYAECQHNCTPGWSCKTRGSRTPFPPPHPSEVQGKVAKWVETKCSGANQDCRHTKCCSASGHTCFEKNDTWAMCRGICDAGPDLYDLDDDKPWTCKALGPETPGVPMEPYKERREVAPWVAKTCAKEYTEDCRESRCCSKPGTQCYEKNHGWAACMMGCTPGHHAGDKDGNWSCKVLGPRTHRPWGKPSLYCLSVVQPTSYEPALMAAQMDTGFGIFACDEFSIFSTSRFHVGDGPLGPVWTETFVPAAVVQSKDGTAGNAEIFMHVWDSVRNLGLYKTAEWTVKCDPDAVVLPERLRRHLEPHTDESVYVVNCAKPYMPEGPMMFGALEAFSRKAMEVYVAKAEDCRNGLDWKTWGEDWYMGHCLDMLGVQKLNDFHIYSDGVCRGVDCSDPDAAAFHPKKSIPDWMACLKETQHPHPISTTDAPQWFKDYMKSYTR